MDFLELVKKRRSVRAYSDIRVDREDLAKCIEAARLAPSACNSQPWKFIMVDEPGLVKGVAGCTYGPLVGFNKFTEKAAAFAVVVKEPGNIASRTGEVFTRNDFANMDMGGAVEHFCLQAAELGIGTCILGWYRPAGIRKLLKIPKNRKIGLLIAIGYPLDSNVRPKNRKDMEEISSYNEY